MVKFKEISTEAFRRSLPYSAVRPWGVMNDYIVEFGYLGPDTKNLLKASVKLARGGKLATLQGFLVNNSLPFA